MPAYCAGRFPPQGACLDGFPVSKRAKTGQLQPLMPAAHPLSTARKLMLEPEMRASRDGSRQYDDAQRPSYNPMPTSNDLCSPPAHTKT